MTQTNGALVVEDVLASGGGMQGSKDVLATVAQDALQEREVLRAAGNARTRGQRCVTVRGPGSRSREHVEAGVVSRASSLPNGLSPTP